jgi:hypothetical protein
MSLFLTNVAENDEQFIIKNNKTLEGDDSKKAMQNFFIFIEMVTPEKPALLVL